MNPNVGETTPVENDLWGRICLDYHRNRSGTFIIRRDDGCTDTVETASCFRSALPDFEVAALERAEGHVLDIGCGVGPDLLWLQEHGKQVTGIDPSPGVIKDAKARGCKDAKARGCKDAQVLSLWDISHLGKEFGTVLMMGNNLGLPGSLEALGRFLGLAREVTCENALLLGHSVDPTDSTNPEHLDYHRKNEAAGRYKGQVLIRMEYRGSVTRWWNLLLLEPPVAEQLLADHGWAVEDLLPAIGSYILVARKE